MTEMEAQSGRATSEPPQESARAVRPARWRRIAGALAVNPFYMLFGPTFQREMRIAGRKRSTYLTRSLYVLVMLALATLTYIGARTAGSAQPAGGVASLQAVQWVAPNVSSTVVIFQFFALLLLVPSLTGGLINEEKRNRTLPALLTTPLPSSEIVLGKLMSRLVLVLILLALTAPILLAVRVFGGARAMPLLAALLVTLATAMFGAAAALMFSVWTRKASTAANLGLALVLVVILLPLGLYIWPMRAATSGGQPSPQLWSLCSPAMVFQLVGQMQRPSGGGMGMLQRDLWLLNVAYSVGLAGLCSAVTIAAFRRAQRAEAVVKGGHESVEPERDPQHQASAGSGSVATDAAASEAGATDSASDETHPQAAMGGVRAATKPVERRAKRVREVSDLPVLWRELRQPVFRAKWRLAVAVLAIGLLMLLVYANADLEQPESYIIVAMAALFGLAAQMATATTSNIPNEREGRMWGILLSTPLSGREIMLSKYAGIVRQVWVVPAIILAHLGVVGVYMEMVSPLIVMHLLLIALGTAGLLAGTGLLLGTVLRRSTSASTANLLGAAGVWLGLPIFGGLFGTFARSSLDWLFSAMTVTNPIMLAGISLAGGVGDRLNTGGIASRNMEFELPAGAIGPLPFTMIVIGATALALAIGFAAALCAGRIARRVSAGAI